MKLGTQGQSGRDAWVRAILLPLTILAWLAVLVVVAWLISHVASTFMVLVLSAVIAFALTPLVNLLQRWMPRWMATALAYVIGFALVFGLLGYVAVSAAGQLAILARELPSYAHRAQGLEPQIVRLLSPWGVTRSQLTGIEERLLTSLEGATGQLARQSLTVISGVFGALFDGLVTLILSIYLVANAPRIRRWLREQAPLSQRRRTNLMIAIVNHVIGGYVRGTLAMATLVGILVGGGMAAFRVPYALLLGILAFFMEFVPILGVVVSGAVCVLVALTRGWVTVVLVLAYFILVHVIEGDLVGPRVLGRSVGIHPAVALVALAAGTELFGIWGALFGAPVAGLIQAIVTAAWREARASRLLDVAEPATSEASGQAELLRRRA